MAIYDRFQSTSQRMLGDFQQGTVKLVKITTGGDPWDPTETEVEHTQDATVKGVSAKYVGMETEGGGMIVASDLEVTVPGGGEVPAMADKYNIDGTVYSIVQVMKIPAAGTAVVYKVIVRR